MQEICRRHDILIVADEVINGFGRLGTMFACEHYGIRPDMLVLSKQITSSYQPLAAVVFSDAIYQGVADSSRAGSAPSATASRRAAIRSRPRSRSRTSPSSRSAASSANAAAGRRASAAARCARFADHPLVGEVRGVGLIAAVELVADKATKRAVRSARQGRPLPLRARPGARPDHPHRSATPSRSARR